MSEPLYTYTKGQGWVPRTIGVLWDVLYREGRKPIRMEIRRPEVGEHYKYLTKDEYPWHHEPGIMLQNVASWITKHGYDIDSLMKRVAPGHKFLDANHYTYITFMNHE